MDMELSGLQLCLNCPSYKKCIDPKKAHLSSDYIRCKYDIVKRSLNEQH